MKKIFLGLLLTVFLIPVHAQNEEYAEGAHYELLSEVQPVQTGDKIEVVELFWYRCPHCFRLEPFLVKWLENIPDNAEYVPIPAVLNQNWILHGRAYYTFEALGLVDPLHGKFFDTIHKDRRQFNSPEEIADWAATHGADRDVFLNTYNSFAVNSKIQFANVMGKKYGITGVPAIIVDGKYRTSVSMAGSHDKLIGLINFLIKKAAEERKT